MGLAASQARFLNLTSQIVAVQRKGQVINNERMAITNELNKLMNGGKNQVAATNPFINGGSESPEYMGKNNNKKNNNSNKNSSQNESSSFSSAIASLFEAVSSYPGGQMASAQVDPAKLASLQSQDAKLELALRGLDTMEQAMKTELSAVTKVIDKNIEASFKLMA